ncbi:MAG: hypothetical protein KGZ68_15390, partial [Dechloromonas sp.]|nr:hypothetical protein [Dechloromonas sp.]
MFLAMYPAPPAATAATPNTIKREVFIDPHLYPVNVSTGRDNAGGIVKLRLMESLRSCLI